jgi:hypothetical protein
MLQLLGAIRKTEKNLEAIRTTMNVIFTSFVCLSARKHV